MTQIMRINPHHPQRINPPARPGELLKRLAGVAARVRLKAIADHDPVYLELIRELPCLNCGQEPCGEAAHVRMQSAAHGKRGGIGKKPGDRWALPLCAEDHREQHQIGEAEFWNRVGLNPLLVAVKLYAQRGNLVAMRAVVFTAIAGRG